MDVCNTCAQYRHYRIYTSCYLEQSQNSVIIDNTGTHIMDDSRQLLDCGKWVPIFTYFHIQCSNGIRVEYGTVSI